MAVIKANINANPNVGLYGIVIGDTLLFGEKLRTKQQELFEKTLGVKLHRLRVAGIDFPGVMLATNNKVLLVPNIIFDSEKRIIEELKIPYKIINTNVTCLGNAIACSEHGAILSTEFLEEEVEQIQEALGVPCKQTDIAGLTSPGAVIIVKDDRAVIHPHASPEEVAIVEQTLKVTVEPATINLGSPHLRAGLIHSKSGLIIGDHSGGPEIVQLDEALGYSQID